MELNTIAVNQNGTHLNDPSTKTPKHEPDQSKLLNYVHHNQFLKTTELGSLNYIGNSDYTIEVYIWIVLVAIFTFGCAYHLNSTLETEDTGVNSIFSSHITTDSSFRNVSQALEFQFCVQNVWSIPTDLETVPLDIEIMAKSVDSYYTPKGLTLKDDMEQRGGLDDFLIQKGEQLDGKPLFDFSKPYPERMPSSKNLFGQVMLAVRRYIMQVNGGQTVTKKAMAIAEQRISTVTVVVQTFTTTYDEILLDLLLNSEKRSDAVEKAKQSEGYANVIKAMNLVLEFADWFESAVYKGSNRWADLIYTYNIYMFSARTGLTAYNKYLRSSDGDPVYNILSVEAELLSLDLNTECYKVGLSYDSASQPSYAPMDSEFLLFNNHVLPDNYDYDRMNEFGITEEEFHTNISDFRDVNARWIMIHDNGQPSQSGSAPTNAFKTDSTGTISIIGTTELLVGCVTQEEDKSAYQNCDQACRRASVASSRTCDPLLPVSETPSSRACQLADYDTDAIRPYLPTITGAMLRLGKYTDVNDDDDTLNAQNACLDSCSYSPPCHLTTFDLNLVSFPLDAEYSTIKITFTFAVGSQYVLETQNWSWTWYGWLADVGGILQLWLGAGLLGLIHLMIHFIKYAITGRWKKLPTT